MYTYSQDPYLSHYGVIGMKWGVRRYQNKDGSWTAAGKKHRNNKISKETNRSSSFKLSTGQKVVLAAAGITIASVLAYKAYRRIGADYIDDVIKQGTLFQRISRTGSDTLKDSFYASRGAIDNNRYVGRLGAVKIFGFDPTKLTTEVTKDIKIASKNSAAKIFNETFDGDTRFYTSLLEDLKHKRVVEFGDVKIPATKVMMRAEKEILKGNYKNPIIYEAYNISQVGGDGVEKTRFFKALLEKGYSGIKDLNDTKYSGYDTHTAAILFDPSAIGKVTVSELSNTEIKNAFALDTIINTGKAYSMPTAASVGLLTIGDALEVNEDRS